MRLDTLAAEVEGARIVGNGYVEVADLAHDSRKAGPGTLFFCVPGGKGDGHGFAAQVVAAVAPAAARFAGDATEELRVVGVTGTNGKTTTAFLVREILEAAEISTGLLGTGKQGLAGQEGGGQAGPSAASRYPA